MNQKKPYDDRHQPDLASLGMHTPGVPEETETAADKQPAGEPVNGDKGEAVKPVEDNLNPESDVNIKKADADNEEAETDNDKAETSDGVITKPVEDTMKDEADLNKGQADMDDGRVEIDDGRAETDDVEIAESVEDTMKGEADMKKDEADKGTDKTDWMKRFDRMRYEEAMETLEQTVGRLESSDLSLDESVTLFQQGMYLARICAGRLNEIEGKISKLIETEQEKMEEIPFDLD